MPPLRRRYAPSFGLGQWSSRIEVSALTLFHRGLSTRRSSTEEADVAKAFFSGIAPLGRIGQPEETASAILFLASDASSYSAGFDLVAVGGIAQVRVRRFGPLALRNLREVRAMQQQTAYSSWITVPVG